MIFSDWGIKLMDSICDGHVDCNDLLSSITGSSTLSLSLSPCMCAHLCLDMALYMHCVYTFIMTCLLEPFFLQFLVQAKVLCNMLSSYSPNIYPSLETEKKWNYGNEKVRIGFSPPWNFREFCLTYGSYS